MKRTLLLALFLWAAAAVKAQDEPQQTEEPKKGFQKEKLFVGGNFGLTFGSYTLINISPQVGYRFTDFFAAGVGLNGQYVRIKEEYSNGNTYRKVAQGVAGLNVFTRIYPIPQLMLQAQPEANYIFGKETYYDTNPRQEYKMDALIVPSLLLGGGAVLPAGRGSYIISVFYDVLQNANSPYGNKPVYNFGFNIGL